MLNKQELATIMGALMDKNINIHYVIEREEYVCSKELKSLEKQIKITDDLTRKISKLINI